MESTIMQSSSAALADSSASSSSPSATRIALTPIERGWPHRRYSILREVLGPDFHGPSSSHTAAPQLIALEAHAMLGGVPDFAKVKLFNSFATTGEGHRTQIAVVAGLLGIKTTDPRTPEAKAIAKQNDLDVIFVKLEDTMAHPNTLELELQRGPVSVRMKGISTGGGNFEILEKKRNYALAA
jgi:L-serine dehydratase